MNKSEIKNIVGRAAWTFAQTFIASFIVVIPAIIDAFNVGDPSAAKALAISGIGAAAAAGLSAVKTVGMTYLNGKENR